MRHPNSWKSITCRLQCRRILRSGPLHALAQNCNITFVFLFTQTHPFPAVSSVAKHKKISECALPSKFTGEKRRPPGGKLRLTPFRTEGTAVAKHTPQGNRNYSPHAYQNAAQPLPLSRYSRSPLLLGFCLSLSLNRSQGMARSPVTLTPFSS